MKILSLALVAASLLVATYLFETDSKRIFVSTTRTSTSTEIGPTSHQTTSSSPNQNSKELPVLLKDFEAAVSESGLTEQDLVRLFQETRGGVDFQKKLPPSVKNKFQALNVWIENEQDRLFKSDGVTREELKEVAESERASPEILEKRERLKEVARTTAVESLVHRLSQKSFIQDEDLETLKRACASDKKCFEASVADLIDANHVLTTDQFALIDLWMKDER